jgi:hypothetical protein
MVKLFAKKSKIIAASSAILFATAFQAGSCTVNVDQALLDQLSNLAGNFHFQGGFTGGGHHDGSDDDGGNDDSSGSTSE